MTEFSIGWRGRRQELPPTLHDETIPFEELTHLIMPSQDPDLLDMNWVLDSFDTFSENIEAHFESVARSLQETFRQTPWLPEALKPQAPPPSRTMPILKAPLSYYGLSKEWISEHRAVSAAVVAFVGTGVFIIWRRRRSDKAKRRAKRAKNGARTELVLLAGSPHSTLTKSLSLDLERRGFVVYIPVSSLSEEQVVHAMSRTDVKALSLDITSVRPSASVDNLSETYIAYSPIQPTRQSRNSPLSSVPLSKLYPTLHRTHCISQH